MPPAPINRRSMLGGVTALAALGLLSACSGPGAQLEFDTSGPPQKGGTLRVGITGGSSADTLDAHTATNQGDYARTQNLYECLATRDREYKLRMRLADSIEPNDTATVWTVKLRSGVKFSNGRPLEPEDVIASFKRITDPDNPGTGAAGLATLDKVVKTGPATVEFRLKAPNSIFDDTLSQVDNNIVPRDYDPDEPVGTGPFMLDSFEPGQQTTLVRNPHYWDGEPYLDQVQLLNFNDDDAVINALLSSQVDCVAAIPMALVKVIEADPRMKILDSVTGRWLPLTMRVDQKPFDDKRVRQAFRLVVDRQQMIDQVLSGYGTIGNDIFAPMDPEGPKFPQRTRDVEKAKQLLADAGYPDGLSVELVTAPINPGVVESAQVYAQQAKDAGITVTIKRVDSTTFYGEGNYLSYPFSQSFWNTKNFLPQADQCTVKASPFNETHWNDADYNELLAKSKAALDPAQRKKHMEAAQRMLYDDGGYIIWGFANNVDAYQSYVVGLETSASGYPLGRYAFAKVWIGDVK